MAALVARYQFIGEGQPRHQATFLHPVNGTEGAREKDALHRGKSNQSLSKRGGLNPFQSPFRFLLDGLKIVNGVEKLVALISVFHIGVNQQRVGL